MVNGSRGESKYNNGCYDYRLDQFVCDSMNSVEGWYVHLNWIFKIELTAKKKKKLKNREKKMQRKRVKFTVHFQLKKMHVPLVT